jgi:putative FmdB family regulatory protein
MPIYEYKCLKCSNDFEAMQKFSDAPIKACPACGGKVKKKMSNTSFHLKGSGWYMTDYAKKSSSNPSPEKKESAPTTPTSETKPTTSSSSDPE